MKLGLMQPYLFPYIGYFQLISACDLFVVHDDVQFIKGGWINRNRILLNTAPKYITLPIAQDHTEKTIMERSFSPAFASDKNCILRQLEGAYKRAPFFRDTMALVETCFACEDTNVARFVTKTIEECCRHLGIATKVVISSALAKNSSTRGIDRVVEINKVLGSTHYLNPPGGMDLYSKSHFRETGLELVFVKPRAIIYRQFNDPFVPSLSIIDILMFNTLDASRQMLNYYDLI